MLAIIEELLNNFNNHKNIGAGQMAKRLRTFVILAKNLCWLLGPTQRFKTAYNSSSGESDVFFWL